MGFLKPKRVDTSAAEAATDRSIDLQERMYEEGKELTQPWYDTGLSAQQQLADLTGVAQEGVPQTEEFGSLQQKFGTAEFEADPGYQFRQAEGNKAIDRAMAARGKFNSPEAIKALAGYNQDLASQEYGNAYNRYSADQSNIYNRLANVAGAGQVAGQQLVGQGGQYAGNVGNLTTGLVNAQQAAQQQNAQRSSSMWGNLIGAGATIGAGFAASDRRLKKNIVLIGNNGDINIYQFRYKDNDDKLYQGVMAQEIQENYPDAVITGDNGFYMVDYNKIPVDFMEVIKCL